MKNLVATMMMIAGVAFYGNTAHAGTGDSSPLSPELKSAKMEPIKMANLPKDARQYIKENFPSKGVTYVSKHKAASGETVYEVGVAMEGKLSILEFDAKGELLNEKVAKK
ncbi:hypothetical protein [Flavobacterium pallidum]|uniref:Beta-lactamase-inhibitor-like PepSY-like domain-containing protein n=1 Tax=Flavobacterium pallidum TaxID=2172098 RepID=A0A2S1SG68_9FLAO|nr:hypothetical protein [Flavobacterium pallidum]AWI25342.1 hypothetical protein HYN49_05200 [Flavobacterium pallidum]